MAKAEAPLTPNFGATKSESPGSPPATTPVSPNATDDSSTGLEWPTFEPWLFPTSSSSNAEPQRAMPVGAPVALRPDDPPQEEVDEAAQAAEDALRLNRALQTRVMHALQQGLPAAQAGNVAQRARVARFLKESGHLPPKKRDPLPRKVSFFSDPMLPGVAPPKNHDATQRALYREKWLSFIGSRSWVAEEDKQLLKALRSQLVEESFRRKYSDRVGSHPQGPQKQLAWQKLREENNNATLETLWNEQWCKVDWQRIAKKLHEGVQKMKGNGNVGKLKRSLMKCKRSATTCYNRFVQVLDPQLSHKPFTKQEDLALLQLSTQHRGFHWKEVSQLLPGRSAWMCFSRYQQQLNVNITKREWTPEEDLKLTRLVQRQGGCHNMSAILAQGGDWGRCPDQLRERYLTRLAPGLKKNEWTPEEIKRLNILVQIFGRGNWKAISAYLPGRCPNSIGCRYENIENPSLKRDREAPLLKGTTAAKALPWTAQEDRALSEAIEKHGAGNWSRVRDDLPGRTANEAWRRFQSLNSENTADMYDLLLATKRKMMRTSSYHTRFAAGRLGEPANAKRLHSEIVASDFRLKISACRQVSQRSKKQRAEGEEDEPVDDSEPTMLSTLNPILDRHLRRINVRRKQEAATTAAAQTLMDRDLDAPVALGGGFAIDDPSRALRGGPSKSSGRISKRLQAERANMEQPAQPSSLQAEAAAEMRRSKEAHEADTATEMPKKRRKSTHPNAEGAAQETADVSGGGLASDETPRARGRGSKASRSSAEEKETKEGEEKKEGEEAKAEAGAEEEKAKEEEVKAEDEVKKEEDVEMAEESEKEEEEAAPEDYLPKAKAMPKARRTSASSAARESGAPYEFNSTASSSSAPVNSPAQEPVVASPAQEPVVEQPPHLPLLLPEQEPTEEAREGQAKSKKKRKEFDEPPAALPEERDDEGQGKRKKERRKKKKREDDAMEELEPPHERINDTRELLPEQQPNEEAREGQGKRKKKRRKKKKKRDDDAVEAAPAADEAPKKKKKKKPVAEEAAPVQALAAPAAEEARKKKKKKKPVAEEAAPVQAQAAPAVEEAPKKKKKKKKTKEPVAEEGAPVEAAAAPAAPAAEEAPKKKKKKKAKPVEEEAAVAPAAPAAEEAPKKKKRTKKAEEAPPPPPAGDEEQ